MYARLVIFKLGPGEGATIRALAEQFDPLYRAQPGFKELRVLGDEPRDLLHVPGMRPVDVHGVLARKYVKRRELEVDETVDGPAVAAVRLDVPRHVVEPRAECTRKLARDRCAPQRSDSLAESRTPGRPDGCVLLP